MAKLTEIKTDRLLLRQWLTDDLADFATLNSDPEVMEFLPCILNREKSDAMAEKIKGLIVENGWGFWAVEVIDSKKFVGFVGLNRPAYELPVYPCVEIGWRLAREHWGKGYATEAAKASLDFAFNELDLDEVYSFTSVFNKKSSAVMERLKMVDQHSNFNHPMVPDTSKYQEHVLYKISRRQWADNHLSR